MEKLGLMTDVGRKMFPMTSFNINNKILNELKKDKVVWDNFNKFPELYRKVRIDTIQIKKNNSEIFNKRLQKFIENTRQNKMFGEWNDNGRLL